MYVLCNKYFEFEYIHRLNSAYRKEKGQCSIAPPPLTLPPTPPLVMYDWFVRQNYIIEISIKLTAYVGLAYKKVTPPRHQILLFNGAIHQEIQQSGHIISINAILFSRARFTRTNVIILKTKHELYGSKAETKLSRKHNKSNVCKNASAF